MFESRSIEQSPIDNVSSNSNEKTRRDTTHKFENLLYYDPEDEEDKPFIQVFLELASTCGIDELLTLSYGNLRTIYSNLNRKTNIISIVNITRIRGLHFFLKHLQEKGCYESGANFYYSSIDEDDYREFTCDPSN